MDEDKPLLVFINPKSGTGAAAKMFHTFLEPALKEKGVKSEVVTTEYAGHAKEFIAKCPDFDAYSGIVSISGDGLIHEIFNGLFHRHDWHEISRIPIGVMPGGTGCALNSSLLRQLQEVREGQVSVGPNESAQNVAVGASLLRNTPLDLLEIELEDGSKHISFLGATVGIIADSDIGSEWLRCLGNFRVYLYVGTRLFFPKNYRIRISYLPLPRDVNGNVVPAPEDTPLALPKLSQPVPDEWVVEETDFRLVYAVNIALLDSMSLFAPESKVGDGIAWLVVVRSSISLRDTIRWTTNLQEGPIDVEAMEVIPVRAFRIEPLSPSEGILTVDGESVPFGSFQGQIIPQKARLLVS
eukprot:snap_masked-scaffold556_size137522-processed-gene-0.20 protein:Tk02046 transcript:snap_masked-scaffold556_size137522-processed-gene-0.20-mRNA-1 annotation:"sphingosine kinase 1-like"